MNFTKEYLQEIVTHALHDYPDECCGVVVVSADDKKIDCYSCKNIQNKLHQEDPEMYPRDARTAYLIDPTDYIKIFNQVQKEGGRIIGIYHSHTDQKKDAYFSQEDREKAFIFPEEPLYDFYFVISIIQGEAVDFRYYQWDSGKKDFQEKIII